MTNSAAPLWTPSADRVARANVTRFIEFAGTRGVSARTMPELYRWSVESPELFWPMVWEFCGIVADGGADDTPWDDVVVGLDRMAPPDARLGPRWFLGARLNFAENLLRYRDTREAIVFWTEEGRQRSLTFAELRHEVARAARAFSASGVRAGDRVAGFLPNLPETIIAMLGAATIGAVWSSCSPDFGAQGVLDRLGQIEPRLLIAADGYRYAGKPIDVMDRVREIREAIPSIERVVIVPHLHPDVDVNRVDGAIRWSDYLGAHTAADEPRFVRLPFDHPLYIMYSSGTTGMPKCMVHGAGGTLLQHLKEHALHTDITRQDRVFYFTTCGWMMWNWLVSTLASGATVVLYDGAPLAPRKDILWEMAATEKVTVFGTSARYLAVCEKEGLRPGASHDLSAVRAILSTGSPLAPHSFDYVYRDIKADVHLASISGGTDIISCFALGNPIGPVWPGEIQMRGLGMKVEIKAPDGDTVTAVPGELCCSMPFPSMPVRFWNDPNGTKYREAYFGVFENVWRHGDWAELTGHGGLMIHGRSDATLNPGGVRIGTAEIYRQVEQLPEIVESLVVGQEWDDDVRIVLFVRLADGAELDEALRDRIRHQIRTNASPHHVPKVIRAVRDIPRTVSGKISELAVREMIHGREVTNIAALANPKALEEFRPAIGGASSSTVGGT